VLRGLVSINSVAFATWHHAGEARRPAVVKHAADNGATENARPENAGLENDGQNFSQLWAKIWPTGSGKCRTAWKMTDHVN